MKILIAPLSNKIDWDKTKPLIAVEMRRLGFDWVHYYKHIKMKNKEDKVEEKWRLLMERILTLAKTVNSP